MPSSPISDPDMAEISALESELLHDLWASTRGVPFTDTLESLRRFTSGLASLVGASNCSWLAGCRGQAPSEPFHMQIFDGWWYADLVNFEPMTDAQEVAKVYLELTRKHGYGLTSQHAVAHAGITRVQLRHDIFDDDAWHSHWLREKFLVPHCNVGERMLAIYTIDDDRESYFLVDRPPGEPPFGEKEKHLAFLAISGMHTLHRRLFAERGLLPPATKPLAPRERETLGLLLEGRSEKEIAAAMDVSTSTAHQYITSLYRIFRTSGRTGLIATYLNSLV